MPDLVIPARDPPGADRYGADLVCDGRTDMAVLAKAFAVPDRGRRNGSTSSTMPATGWAMPTSGSTGRHSRRPPRASSFFGYDPDIPGDFEEKAAIMEKEYRETLDDLVAKGLFDDEPIPGALAIKSYLVLHKDGDEKSPD